MGIFGLVFFRISDYKNKYRQPSAHLSRRMTIMSLIFSAL
jgi:hypothetical protein